MSARMPAETARHERTIMCWPARRDLYGELFRAAEEAHAEVANAIAAHEPVTMIAAPGAAVERAERLCGAGVEVVALPLDDSWCRDTGPIYVLDGDQRTALDWVFNGWGAKYEPIGDDTMLARRWAEHAGHPVRAVDMVLEGGAIAVDGDGALVTTEQCLLNPNRNPGLDRATIERHLAAELGADAIVWLPHGLADDDDTDGHVDNVAAFAAPGRLLLQGCRDTGEPDHVRLLANACAAAGAGMDVVEVPVLPFADMGGVRRPVPYLNYYVGNGFVAVPVCGHAADLDICALIAGHYPGRDVIALDVGAVLAYGGGGIHCITQQVPAIPTADATA